MNILEKIFDKLHLNFSILNRKNSPSIKADGNIIVGGNIIANNIGKSPKAAVLNKGKRNTFINTKMVGTDYGIIDEGEDTKVIDSDIRNVK